MGLLKESHWQGKWIAAGSGGSVSYVKGTAGGDDERNIKTGASG